MWPCYGQGSVPTISRRALRKPSTTLTNRTDYEFDFNISTRIVCTELIYRCFNNRGPIEFTLIKRLGRYTLSGDDIMNQWLGSLDSSEQYSTVGFDLVTLVLKMDHGRAEFFEGPQALDALHRIQGGWRATSQ